MFQGGKEKDGGGGQQQPAYHLQNQGAFWHRPGTSHDDKGQHQHRLNEKAPESNLQRASCLAKKFGKHIKTRQNKHPHAEQRHAASRMLYSMDDLIHRRILRVVS